jgi:DNA polymerase bacteriophage-type
MVTYIDLETRSPVDLRAEGGRRYAEHPGTEILTVAWIHGEGRCVWFPGLTVMPPAGLLATQLPGVTVYVGPVNPVPPGPLVAHNAWGFDSHVWKAVTGQDREWLDTEPLARACGLPGGIDKIGERLRGAGKHKEGKARLLKFCKSDSKRPGVGDLCMIAKYNLDDVEILKLAYEYVQARPLSPTEKRVLTVHRRMNDRGVRIDRGLCTKIAGLSELATIRTVTAIAEKTDGQLGSLKDLASRDKVFKWVAEQGAKVGKSLKKDTIETLFRDHDDEAEDADDIVLTPLVREVLTLRFSALRISGGKVSAALKAAFHGRLHELLVYFGASPTGRWAGRRFQPQNLPRPVPGVDPWRLMETDLSVEAVLACIEDTVAEMVAKGTWDPLWHYPTLDDAISGLLRGILIPDDGKLFAASDYNAIEPRSIGWLFEPKLLQYFIDGRCPYSAMAKKMTGREVTGKKDPMRQAAKVVILAGIYQVGAAKLSMYALAQNIDLAKVGLSAEKAIEDFRDEFPGLAGEMTSQGYRRGGAWNEMHYAAIRACTTGKAEYMGIGFRHDGRDLKVYLPSGRPMYYPQAAVENVVPKWGGEPKKTVVFSSSKGFRDIMYGGRWVQHVNQANARDLLAESLVNVEEAGIQVPFTVHDEEVAQVADEAEGKRFASIMVQKPIWAKGLPIAVEMDMMSRYSKSAPPGMLKEYVLTS